jgi:hypothetical protein
MSYALISGAGRGMLDFQIFFRKKISKSTEVLRFSGQYIRIACECRRKKLQTVELQNRLKGLEGDDRSRILYPRNCLDALIYKVSDIGITFDIELDQEIIVACRRIDFRGDLRVGKLIRDIIGLAELAFDLDKERDHFILLRVA